MKNLTPIILSFSLSVSSYAVANGDSGNVELPPLPQEKAQAIQQQQARTAPSRQQPIGQQRPAATVSVEERNRAIAKQKRNELDKTAFEILKERTLPLKPEQIKELRRMLDASQEAVAALPTAPPTPVSSSKVVNLSPGVTPPVIRLATGHITSLVFVDSTGAPWPISAYGLGDPTSFNIQWDSTSNVLMVQSLKNYSSGNLAVRLFGITTPVTLSLVSNQHEVDYRVDLQVLGRGPNARAPIFETETSSNASPTLLNLLDGIPPKGSIKLEVNGDAGEAWAKGKVVYYRTRLTLISPAWTSSVSSADGTTVYELASTPLLLATKDGHTVKIRLSGF